MSDDGPITVLIEQARQGKPVDGMLFLHFQAELERTANRAIKGALQRIVRGSDVYTETFLNVLAALPQMQTPFHDRHAFGRYLKQALENHILSWQRATAALKRGGGEVESLILDAPDQAPTPLDALVSQEDADFIERMVNMLESEVSNISDPVDQTIASLGVLRGASGAQIQEALRRVLPRDEIPSVRTIQRRLSALREHVKQALCDRMGPLDVNAIKTD